MQPCSRASLEHGARASQRTQLALPLLLLLGRSLGISQATRSLAEQLLLRAAPSPTAPVRHLHKPRGVGERAWPAICVRGLDVGVRGVAPTQLPALISPRDLAIGLEIWELGSMKSRSALHGCTTGAALDHQSRVPKHPQAPCRGLGRG
jgi:hypothetical protein